MKSIDVIQFKCNLESYIDSVEMPTEVKRMVLADIFKKVSDKAYQEVMEEMKEKENENVSEESDS